MYATLASSKNWYSYGPFGIRPDLDPGRYRFRALIKLDRD